MKGRRVVVTGLGMVTPVGNNVPDTWQALLAGKSGVEPIKAFDASDYPVHFCAEVKDFNPEPLLSSKDQRKFDYFVQYACVAANEALKDAGIESPVDSAIAHRYGVAIGSGIGGLAGIQSNYEALLKGGPRRVAPSFIPGSIINMAPGLTAIQHGLKGLNISVVSACTTGVHNIGLAARAIAYGDADVVLAGGTEKASTELGIAGFSAARALSRRNDDPKRASRPWDRDRDGFVLGDGAGVLVLESYESAKARGASIYAEVLGFGMSDDANHITAPDPEGKGFVMAMQAALDDAGIAANEVHYINAHGTSTPAADHLEAAAIKEVFGAHVKDVLVSSTKSMIGHLLGAAGAVESIISILAIKDQKAPPTINLENPADGCDLDFVPHTAREAKIDTVLSNSFGFGGTNACAIFRALSDDS